MSPRYISPHPYTNQPVVALARGPLIYCVEDAENTWVNDHFKSLLYDHMIAEIEPDWRADSDIGEPYMTLVARGGASFLNLEGENGPQVNVVLTEKGVIKELNFVPYCLRDNRGGKGHMRVGLRRKN
jgi:DUF1680 family protein